jgi:hypothetical protein
MIQTHFGGFYHWKLLLGFSSSMTDGVQHEKIIRGAGYNFLAGCATSAVPLNQAKEAPKVRIFAYQDFIKKRCDFDGGSGQRISWRMLLWSLC